MPKILLDLIIPAKLQGTEIDAAIPAGGGHVLLLGLLLRLGLGGDGGELGGVGQVGLGLGLVLLGLLGLLGLAEKAGKVRSGEFSTEKAVKSGKAGLVIVSEESSDNTKKMFRNMCTYYKVPYFEFGSKEELGHILGKQMRASLAVIDENFSNALLKHFTAKA